MVICIHAIGYVAKHTRLGVWQKVKLPICLFVCVGFYVTSTVLQSLRDVRLNQVEEDPRNPSELHRRTTG